jgi:hypothetical protein
MGDVRVLRPLQHHNIRTLLLDFNHIAGLKRSYRSVLPINRRCHGEIIPRRSQSDKPLQTRAAWLLNVLGQSISPTQAQMQAIQNKVNELINAITRPAVYAATQSSSTACRWSNSRVTLQRH